MSVLHALTRYSAIQIWGTATAVFVIVWISLVLRIGTMRTNRTELEQRVSGGLASAWPSSNRELFDRETYSPQGRRLFPWLIVSLVLTIACGLGLLLALVR
jgi:hypothetical protein